MGIKGDKLTNQSMVKADFLVSSLSTLGNVKAKKMFGGHGIFYFDKMFAIVDAKGKCFLKVDNDLSQEFMEEGSVKHAKMPYFSVPKNILDNQKLLLDWAKKSIKLLA